MKKQTLLLMLSAIFTLCGCIREDRDDCRRSFTLLFEYYGDGVKDIFRQKIEKVHLYVYGSESEQPVFQKEINRSDLEELQGVRLDGLRPGRYRTVCWGNALSHTFIRHADVLSKSHVSTPEYCENRPASTSDPLYHACLTFTITNAFTAQEATAKFNCAHIDFNVRMEGFNNLVIPAENPALHVETSLPCLLGMENFYGYYDFGANRFDPAATYIPPVETTAEASGGYTASFSTLRFDENDETALTLRHISTNRLFYRLPLKHFLADNRLSVSDRQEVTVNILLKLNKDGINLTVTPFEETDVHPGLDEK